MKITTEQKPAPFAPCSITFTFESQAELDGFTSLFNCAWVTDAVEDAIPGARIPGILALEKLGGNMGFTAQIYNALRVKLK